MGSSGNGMFGTYRGGGAGALANGGNGSENKCPLEIDNIRLEDVAISDYYREHCNVPKATEMVELAEEIVNKRLVVILSSSKQVIGNMPVPYNYLNLCIKSGMHYHGGIKASGLSPIPYIVVNLYAK